MLASSYLIEGGVKFKVQRWIHIETRRKEGNPLLAEYYTRSVGSTLCVLIAISHYAYLISFGSSFSFGYYN